MEKILVTGYPGWLGSRLVERILKETDHKLRCLVLRNIQLESTPFQIVRGDVREYYTLLEATRDVDTVIHCCGIIHSKPRILMDINAQGTLNMLNASERNRVKNFIYISSNSAVGCTKDKTLMTESTAREPYMTYGKSKFLAEEYVNGFSLDGKLRTVILRPCYDAKTRIVTEHGIKEFDEVTVGELVWTLGENDKLELQPVIDKIEYDYTGEMIKLKNRQLDQLITPDHNVFFKKRNVKNSKWEICKAEKLKELTKHTRVYLPTRGNWEGSDLEFISPKDVISKPLHDNTTRLPEQIRVSTLLSLLGWFINEGCIVDTNKIIFRSCDNNNRNEIRNLLEKLGLSPINKRSSVEVSCLELANILGTCGKCPYDKFIPEWALRFSQSKLAYLFNALMNGKSRRRLEYFAVSEKLRDGFILLCMKLGYTCYFRKEKIQERITSGSVYQKHDVWRISVRDQQTKGGIEGRQVTTEVYSGRVWDIVVPNHVFLTERNGALVFSGNCWYYGVEQPERQTRLFKMIRGGKPLIVGDGTNLRSMTYTDNLIDAILLAVSRDDITGRTYWIADSRPYTMNEIYETIARILNVKEYKPVYLPKFLSSIGRSLDGLLQSMNIYNQIIHVLGESTQNIACDISRARTELGYDPKVELEEGMRLSIEWCKRNKLL